MNLESQQKAALAQWVSEGLSLKEIQDRLSSEFGIAMTYMDVRFLIDDLDLSFEKKAEPVVEEVEAAPSESEIVDAGEPEVMPEAGAAGTLSVSVDRINQPSMIVSGNVTFSDGVQGSWGIDQAGRLVLKTGQEGYEPGAADLQDFQEKLAKVLQSKGFYS